MTSTQPDPAATTADDESANTTAQDPGDGTEGVGADDEVEAYVENPDHIPNPLYQSGVVDTSGVSGGLPDVNQATPVFAQHRAASLRIAADEFKDGVEDHVVIPDGADQDRRDAIGEKLDKSASVAEEDPRVQPEASQALAEELEARNAAPGAETQESAAVAGTGSDDEDGQAASDSSASNDSTSDGTTSSASDPGTTQARSSEAAATTQSTTATDPAGNVQTNADADQTSKQAAKADSTDSSSTTTS